MRFVRDNIGYCHNDLLKSVNRQVTEVTTSNLFYGRKKTGMTNGLRLNHDPCVTTYSIPRQEILEYQVI